jgi:hypothetical protein
VRSERASLRALVLIHHREELHPLGEWRGDKSCGSIGQRKRGSSQRAYYMFMHICCCCMPLNCLKALAAKRCESNKRILICARGSSDPRGSLTPPGSLSCKRRKRRYNRSERARNERHRARRNCIEKKWTLRQRDFLFLNQLCRLREIAAGFIQFMRDSSAK